MATKQTTIETEPALRRYLGKAEMLPIHLAKAMGIAPSSVSRWLTGATRPRADHMAEILKIINKKLDKPVTSRDVLRRVAKRAA